MHPQIVAQILCSVYTCYGERDFKKALGMADRDGVLLLLRAVLSCCLLCSCGR